MVYEGPFITLGTIGFVEYGDGLDTLFFAGFHCLHEIHSSVSSSLHECDCPFGIQIPRQARYPKPHLFFLFEAVIVAARKNHTEEVHVLPVSLEQLSDERVGAVQGGGDLPLAFVVAADHRAVKKFSRMNKSRQSLRDFFAVIKSSRSNELALHLIDENDFG